LFKCILVWIFRADKSWALFSISIPPSPLFLVLAGSSVGFLIHPLRQTLAHGLFGSRKAKILHTIYPIRLLFASICE
jgi:hypothetical protein